MGSAEVGDATLSKKKRERPRFPLVAKLFLLTALLIALVVALAVGLTIRRSSEVATRTVNDAIARTARLFKDLEQKRLKELSLGAFSLSRHVPFNSYIESALQNDPPDLASILDQLQEQQPILGSDMIMVTDDQGILLARNDRPLSLNAAPEDLYQSQPLVQASIDSGNPEALAGVMNLDNRLYHAAVAPLRVGADRPTLGYLVNAYAIDSKFADQIAESTNTGVLFVPAGRGEAVRSANAPSAEGIWMGELDGLFNSGNKVPPSTATIDRSEYVMTAEPLSSQGAPAGAAVFVRSLDSELAPFRQIERTLIAAGVAALILAFIFSWLIAKRLTQPITDLASMAQSVTEGDYSVQPVFKRSDEIGILGRSFGKMISALRDKAELEQLVQEMSARANEAPAHLPKTIPPRLSEGTIMVTDLRGTPASVDDGGADKVISLVRDAVKLQENEIRRQDGRVIELVGHRLVSVFEGERSAAHAIRAARAIDEELGLRMAGQYPMTVGVGIATGDYVCGSVELNEGETGIALIGNAPLLALLFAWEAPNAHAFVSPESMQSATQDISAQARREEVRLRWLPNPMPVFSVPLASLGTGTMRAQSSTLGGAATLRLGETQPGERPAEMTAGTVFAGRYVIEQVLGRGGMGIVYRANDRQLDETVAIKTLPGDLKRSAEEVERFKREIRLARKITHRNVLRTYDYGESEGMYFISMECVRGYTLAELEEKQTLSPRAALGIARQACRGLQAAHEQGIIHRDIKPQNVLIDARGEVKLMDFGIARMTEAGEALTTAGLIVGTPHYMSPEQIQAKTLDPRSDVYSMGVVMYEMLCGRKPFDNPALTAVLTAHIAEPPRPPIEIRPEIGAEVNRIILRCLSKEPAQRYANAGELLQDLDRLQVAPAAAA